MPQYHRCSIEEKSEEDSSPKFKLELFLPDKKNSKLDLRFTPNQTFSSEKVAKDFAALLALWHFQVRWRFQFIETVSDDLFKHELENSSVGEQAS